MHECLVPDWKELSITDGELHGVHLDIAGTLWGCHTVAVVHDESYVNLQSY